MFVAGREGGLAGGHIGALDGLRALAVMAVLLFHADLGWMPGGFLGVSVFFTLSGFLITSLLVEEHRRSGTVALRAFYGRRARRLVPAAYLCIGVVVALGVCWGATQRRDLPGDAVAAVANVANWRFAFAARTYQDLFIGSPSPLAHFWSLAIEEQCYLVLPLVAWWALRTGGRRRLGLVLAALLVASAAATALTSDRNLLYHGTHTRAAELLVGAIAATLMAGRRPSGRWAVVLAAAGLLSLAVLTRTASLADSWLYHGGLLLVSVCSLAAVVGLLGDHGVARAVGCPPLVAIGRVSYGLYLFHWPVFLLLTEARLRFGGISLLVARCAATVVVTLGSYRLLEQPIRRRTRLVRPRVALPALVGGAAGLVGAALLLVPAPHFTRTEQLLAMGSAGPMAFQPPPSSQPQPPPAPTVLVVGSADAPVPALQAAGFTVVDGVQPGCPVAHGAAARSHSGMVFDIAGCEPALTRWQRLLAEVRPAAVVLSMGALDTALVAPRADALPRRDDVAATSALLSVAETEVRDAVGALTAADVPVVFFDGVPDGWGADNLLPGLAVEAGTGRAVQRALDDMVAAVRTEVGAPAGGAKATRVLVMGDSTSLDMAKALNDGGAGAVVVQWAGANGCPLVRAEAVRAGAGFPWASGVCPDFALALPPVLAQFHPDVVLVVLGPTELEDQRYPGDAAVHVAGDAAFTAFHDRELQALLGLLPGIPVVVADAPPIRPGQWTSGPMASPERLAAWNAQVRRWDESSQQVRVLPYAAALVEYEAAHGDIRADGVHPDVGALTTIVRDRLLPNVLGVPEP